MSDGDNQISWQIKAADRVSMDMLLQAMNAAFADYEVPMKLDCGAFALMMRVRGLSLRFSRVAIFEDTIVAFWLVGTRGRRAYLISSGTIPTYRRQGLSLLLGKAVIEALKVSHFDTLQSEVLAHNEKARALYRSLGFTEVRDLDCYSLPAPTTSQKAPSIEIIEQPSVPHDAEVSWDIRPSWQNDTQSMLAAEKEAVTLAYQDEAGLAAYATFLPKQHNLTQLVVRKELRRQGIATALLAKGSRQTGVRSWRVINVDRSGRDMRAFLMACDAQETVSQKELLLHL